MSVDPSEPSCGETLSPSAEGKIRKFCFELALALRRITGRKIEQGLEGLPQVIREAIENANRTDGNDHPEQPEE